LSTVRDFLRNHSAIEGAPSPAARLQLVDSAAPARRKTPEAGDILPAVREQINYDFHYGLKSTRKLAKKYRLPRAVVQDIILLATRVQPQTARLTAIDAFCQRRTA
jgi:hypothetical protein